jgi:hypothetical protein
MLLSFVEEELIRRIIQGCDRFVCDLEAERYDRRWKPPKPSQSQLVGLSVLYPSVEIPYTSDGFRSFPQVNGRLSEVEKVDPSLVNRTLKSYVNVGYYRKDSGKKHSEIHGPNKKYYESDYLHSLKTLVSKRIPRTLIYCELLKTNILSRYFTLVYYSEILTRKYIDVEEMIKVKRARGIIYTEKQIEALREAYHKDREFYKNKTNKRKILPIAQKLAEKDLQNRLLDDSRFTVFFVMGGNFYGEIELLPYRQ